MSAANVLPSAAPMIEEPPLHPDLSAFSANIHMSEISKIEKMIADEVENYHTVLKKNTKKIKKVLHWAAVGLGGASVTISSGAVASAFTRVGIVVGAPLAAVGAACGLTSTGITGFSRTLDHKIENIRKLLLWGWPNRLHQE